MCLALLEPVGHDSVLAVTCGRGSQSPGQREVQQRLLRLHLAACPSRHHYARRDVTWTCRRCVRVCVSGSLGPTSVAPQCPPSHGRSGRFIFVATAAGLRVEFVGVEDASVPGAVAALFAPRRVAAAALEAGQEARSRVIHVVNKRNVLSLLWLASLDAWRHVVKFL